MTSLLMGLALLVETAAGSQGEWHTYNREQIPFAQSLQSLESGPDGSIRMFSNDRNTSVPRVVTYDGKGYTQDSLPPNWNSPPCAGSSSWFLFENPRNYWVQKGKVCPQGDYHSSVFHVVDGKEIATPSCLDFGNPAYLGKDPQGRILFQSERTAGILRVRQDACDTLTLGNLGSIRVDSYGFDGKGKQYFGTRSVDFGYFGPLLRLDNGELDTLAPSVAVEKIAALDSEAVIATGINGFLLAAKDGLRNIKSVHGRELGAILSLFVDSRKTIWLAAEGNYLKPKRFLVSISGEDSTIFDSVYSNVNLPIERNPAGSGIGEDTEGNIWTTANYDEVAVFLRGQILRTVSPKLRNIGRGHVTGRFDLVGRSIPENSSRQGMPWVDFSGRRGSR